MRPGWAAASKTPIMPPDDSPTQCTRRGPARRAPRSPAPRSPPACSGSPQAAGRTGRRRAGRDGRRGGSRRPPGPSGSRTCCCARSRASSRPATSRPTATNNHRRRSAAPPRPPQESSHRRLPSHRRQRSESQCADPTGTRLLRRVAPRNDLVFAAPRLATILLTGMRFGGRTGYERDGQGRHRRHRRLRRIHIQGAGRLGELPEGWAFDDVAAVVVDSQDRVYVSIAASTR